MALPPSILCSWVHFHSSHRIAPLLDVSGGSGWHAGWQGVLRVGANDAGGHRPPAAGWRVGGCSGNKQKHNAAIGCMHPNVPALPPTSTSLPPSASAPSAYQTAPKPATMTSRILPRPAAPEGPQV